MLRTWVQESNKSDITSCLQPSIHAFIFSHLDRLWQPSVHFTFLQFFFPWLINWPSFLQNPCPPGKHPSSSWFCLWFFSLVSAFTIPVLLQCYCCAVLSCSVTSLWPHGLAHQAPLSMEILQARILEWVAMPSSRSCSQPRDRTQVSHIAGEFFIIWILVNFKYIYSQSHVVMCFPHPVYPSFLSPWCALDHLFAWIILSHYPRAHFITYAF